MVHIFARRRRMVAGPGPASLRAAARAVHLAHAASNKPAADGEEALYRVPPPEARA